MYVNLEQNWFWNLGNERVQGFKINLSPGKVLEIFFWKKGTNPSTPWVTKREFLPTVSIQYQTDKWWQKIKISVWESLVDPKPDSPTNITRIVWQIVRRITNEILGLKRLTTFNLKELYACVVCWVRFILFLSLFTLSFLDFRFNGCLCDEGSSKWFHRYFNTARFILRKGEAD